MDAAASLAPGADRLGARDFQRLAELIQRSCGIRMPPAKKTMVEGRLRRRVRALGLASLDEYCHRLFNDGLLATELVALINAVTTNKTDFFREPEHFRLLTERFLPEWHASAGGASADRPLRLWSAASSTGAEAYTLAMVCDDFATRTRGFAFDILATDISTDVLETAKLAIYPQPMIAPVPRDWQRRYFLRSRDTQRPTVRLTPAIRACVRFGRLNLMDEDYPVGGAMDIIFCRNILIYFQKETQVAVLARLCRHLRPNGLLFISHTETVMGMGLPVEPVAAAVFVRR